MRTSPFTFVTFTLPDALLARKSSLKSCAVIEPLAEFTCTDRSTLLTSIDPDAESIFTGPCKSLSVCPPDATVVVTSAFRGNSIVYSIETPLIRLSSLPTRMMSGFCSIGGFAESSLACLSGSLNRNPCARISP